MTVQASLKYMKWFYLISNIYYDDPSSLRSFATYALSGTIIATAMTAELLNCQVHEGKKE